MKKTARRPIFPYLSIMRGFGAKNQHLQQAVKITACRPLQFGRARLIAPAAAG
jgi:hypothetical protein